jgi:hypothetical protein
MSINYDRAYRTLRLEPGASLQEIEEEWKFLASAIHPDRWSAGHMQDKANRDLREINDARDRLRQWWHQNNCPPPSAESQDPPEKEPPPPPSTYATDTDLDMEQTVPFDDVEVVLDSTPPPFWTAGPPSFKKAAKHHVYDAFLAQSSQRAGAVGSFLGMGVIGAASALVYKLLTFSFSSFSPDFANFDSGLSLIPLLGTGALLIAAGCLINTDMKLYKVQRDPYCQPVLKPAADALQQLSAIIAGSKFCGFSWTTETAGQEGECSTQVYRMEFGRGEMQTRLKLNAKAMPTGLLTSRLCYWFEIAAPVTWGQMASRVVIDTDRALWKGLK